MIAAHHKFPLRTEFTRFRANAQKAVTPHTLIYHLKSPISSRLSVVIPKKVSKLATTRNWLKRLTYDTLWHLVQDRQLDCVVVYKPLPLTKSPLIRQQIITELQKIS